MAKYDIQKAVGEGEYGKVYMAKETSTGNIVALKEIKINGVKEGIPSSSVREVSLLQMLSNSEYVVRLLGVEIIDKGQNFVMYLVLEYADTDLENFMGWNPLDPSLIKNLMFQLCLGVAYCHGNGVLHRDLKPNNLLVVTNKKQESLKLKIADLGYGRTFTLPVRTYTHEVAMRPYRAPEILAGNGTERYTTALDIWSVGCIFGEMVRGKVLFDCETEIIQMNVIYKLLGTPTEKRLPGFTAEPSSTKLGPEEKDLASACPGLSPQGVDLLTGMLKLNPDERISARAALSHPYFDSLDKSKF